MYYFDVIAKIKVKTIYFFLNKKIYRNLSSEINQI